MKLVVQNICPHCRRFVSGEYCPGEVHNCPYGDCGQQFYVVFFEDNIAFVMQYPEDFQRYAQEFLPGVF